MSSPQRFNTLRLQQLIDHHRSGIHGRPKFSMNCTIDSSASCAAGELPFAFPELWEVAQDGSAILLKQDNRSELEDVMTFFNADEEQIHHLFMNSDLHRYQSLNKYGGQLLTYGTTREQWIRHAEEFLEKIG